MEWYHVCLIVLVVMLVIVVIAFTVVGCIMKNLYFTHANRNAGDNPVGFDKIMGDDYELACEFGKEQGQAFGKLKPEPIDVNTDDGLMLRGTFYKSLNPTANTTVICFHGFRGSPEWDFGTLCMYLVSNYNLMYVNHRGHNASDGNEIDFAQKSCYDVNKWIDKAEILTPECNIVLHGVSMGATVLLLASNILTSEKVKFIVSDSAFSDGGKQINYMVKYAKAPVFPIAAFCKAWFKIYTGCKINKLKPVDTLKHAKVPVLFVHGTADKFVPFFMAKEVYDACASEKDFLWVDGAGHGMSYFKNKTEYENKYAEFVAKYCV